MLLSSSATVTDVEHRHLAPDLPEGSKVRDLQKREFVRIAVQTDSPGFAYKDPATARRSGLDVYLSKLIAQSIYGGTMEEATEHIEFVDVNVRDRIAICSSGDVDMVIAMFAITEERRKHIDFTRAYFGSHLGLVVRPGDEDIDIQNAGIVVVDTTTSAEFVSRNAIGSSVIVVGHNDELLPAVESGVADAAVNTNALLAGHLRNEPHDVIRAKSSFPFDTWAVGVPKCSGDLCSFLDSRLKSIDDAGKLMSATRVCG